jgi:Tol biopolymer transport system component
VQIYSADTEPVLRPVIVTPGPSALRSMAMSDAQTSTPRFHEAHRRAGRPLGLSLVVASLLCSDTPLLEAQSAQQDLPTIDVTYTRIVTVPDGDAGGASLSPDGRWVAFRKYIGPRESHLWMVSSEGGDPFPVTSGPLDDGVKWFPDGDRIAYRSEDRVASLAIDPATGRPIGAPRRVTIESSNAYFCISPDGRWIAYTPRNQEGRRVIRVVPSIGGVTRTLTEAHTSGCLWAPDGEGIYYITGRLESPHKALMWVPIDGGPPDTVFTHPGTFGMELVAGRVYLFLQSRSNTPSRGRRSWPRWTAGHWAR